MPDAWQRTFSKNSWVGLVLANPTGSPRNNLRHSKSIKINEPAIGVLEIDPVIEGQTSLLLSCGIHGNETAPIELVSQLVDDILSGALPVANRLLIMIGHPPAAVAGQRFINENLNRLFGDNDPSPATYEAERAAALRLIAAKFFAIEAERKYHFDLHTAIRPSKFEKFAVSPHDQLLDPETLKLLGNAGIEAVLESHKPASTFSYFTATQAGATAFTLELGKVAPFGENDLNRLAGINNTLRAMIQSQTLHDPKRQPLRFTVIKELLRTSESYQLLIDEKTSNFASFAKNTQIDEDGDVGYRTRQPDEHIVFPNPNVPVGQRTGLMVVKISNKSPNTHA